MTEVELAEQVRRIERNHHQDGDGGYAAVDELRALLHSLEPEDQRLLKAVLLDLISRREPGTWSLAWEALVQERATDVAPEVLMLLQSRHLDVEWSDDLVMGLLRIGYQDGADYYVRYIRERWSQAKTIVMPMVAALARVSPDQSLRMGAEYIEEAKDSNLAERVERCAASFVRHYLAVDEHLLARLVTVLKSGEPATASWLASVLNAYLSKPWMLKELGNERSARIRREIVAAGNGSN